MIFTQNSDDVVVMEAENGDLTAGDSIYWAAVLNSGAGNGKALQPSGQTWDKPHAGTIDFQFQISVAGDYDMFFRVLTNGQEGKIWLEIDGQLNAVGPKDNGRLYFRADQYTWHNGHDNAYVTLSAGTHRIRIISITSAMILDRLAIVPLGTPLFVDGSTDVGPAETGSSSSGGNSGSSGQTNTDKNRPPQVYYEPEEIPYTYQAWIENADRDPNRVLLIEIEHSEGQIGLGSRAFLSDEGLPYDPWLLSSPKLQFSLLSLVDGIGDIEAHLSPLVDDDWFSKEWRGHRCRFYFGDEDWAKSDFRLIAAATVEDCKRIGPRSFRFEVAGDISQYDRTYATADSTRTKRVDDAVAWICEQAGFPAPAFLNMEDVVDKVVRWDVTDSSTMYADIKAITDSVSAYPRVTQLGGLEIIKPETFDEPVVTIENSQTIDGSIREIESVSAYKRITVEYSGGQVSRETAAQTGDLDEELVITTVLNNVSDANDFADEQAVRYAKKQRIWSVDVINLTNRIREGDYVSFDHDEIQGAGVIVTSSPGLDTAVGTIEVMI